MMPEFVVRLIDVLGYDDAIAVVSRFGGARIYIPVNPNRLTFNPLTGLIGLDKMRRIIKDIGPGEYEVPKCSDWLARQRNQEIVRCSRDGETVVDLATRFRLTERHVYRILRDADG